MNALRHVTYHPKEPWLPYADFIKKGLAERVKYVRGNLRDKNERAVSQAMLAAAVGLSSGHHGVRRWEKGAQPQAENRQALAAITPYPPYAFTRLGAEGVSLESIDARLQSLEDQVTEAVTLMKEALLLLRATPPRSGAARQAQSPTG